MSREKFRRPQLQGPNIVHTSTVSGSKIVHTSTALKCFPLARSLVVAMNIVDVVDLVVGLVDVDLDVDVVDVDLVNVDFVDVELVCTLKDARTLKNVCEPKNVARHAMSQSLFNAQVHH